MTKDAGVRRSRESGGQSRSEPAGTWGDTSGLRLAERPGACETITKFTVQFQALKGGKLEACAGRALPAVTQQWARCACANAPSLVHCKD